MTTVTPENLLSAPYSDHQLHADRRVAALATYAFVAGDTPFADAACIDVKNQRTSPCGRILAEFGAIPTERVSACRTTWPRLGELTSAAGQPTSSSCRRHRPLCLSSLLCHQRKELKSKGEQPCRYFPGEPKTDENGRSSSATQSAWERGEPGTYGATACNSDRRAPQVCPRSKRAPATLKQSWASGPNPRSPIGDNGMKRLLLLSR